MEYKLIRSKRKTIELSIDDDFIPLIEAPLKMSTEDIEKFVLKHEKWIEKHVLKKREHAEKYSLSEEEISVLKMKALPYLTERTNYFAGIMGVKPTGIKITSAEKRFGSNIRLRLLIMLLFMNLLISFIKIMVRNFIN